MLNGWLNIKLLSLNNPGTGSLNASLTKIKSRVGKYKFYFVSGQLICVTKAHMYDKDRRFIFRILKFIFILFGMAAMPFLCRGV